MIEERDFTVLDMVDVPCPQCGKSLGQVSANTLDWVAWTVEEHDCGYSGPVEWFNPNPPSAVWAARQLRQLQPEHSHS